MKELRIEIKTDGTSKVEIWEYKEVYRNDKHICFENKYKTLSIFDLKKEKYNTHSILDEIYTYDWLKSDLSKCIRFGIYTEGVINKKFTALKKHITKYFNKNYGFIANFKVEDLKLPDKLEQN